MAYIGKNLVGVLNESRTVDTMTGDNSTTTLALSRTPGSMNNVLVFIDGIRQTPDTDYTLSGSTLTFTTAPETGVSVSVISGNDTAIVPDKGSVSATKLVDGSITDAKIVGMSSSKLSGALPAIDGSALTGFSSYTVIAADPTITTNPADGVGSLYVNSTSGEVYICTDATTDNNIWTNVGGGEGDVEPWQLGGVVAGFYSGGSPDGVTIDTFSFVTDGDATNHGDVMSPGRSYLSGASSTTHGYNAGGWEPMNRIDKFQFATASDATEHGTLTTNSMGSHPCQSDTHGYTVGGSTGETTYVQRYPFAGSGVTSEEFNSITNARKYGAGHSTQTDGYVSGGQPATTTIDKFSYSNSTETSEHGNLTAITVAYNCGVSSSADGYSCGGEKQDGSGQKSAKIDKFSFASTNVSAVGHGDLYADGLGAAQSSTTHGYFTGGNGTNLSPAAGASGSPHQSYEFIQKFAYASNTTAADIGNLISNRIVGAGQQY